MDQVQDVVKTGQVYLEHLQRYVVKVIDDPRSGYNDALAWVQEGQNAKLLRGVVLGLVVLSLLLFEVMGNRKKTKGQRRGTPVTLLVGSTDAGKTSLFASISQKEYPQTHTSVQPSVSIFPFKNPSDPKETRWMRLVDLPGHPRLRDEAQKHMENVSSVIFVVDIVAVVRNANTVAESLPPLLTLLASNANKTSQPIRLLLLAHKTDLLIRPAPPMSNSPPDLPDTIRTTATDRLKSMLTREMDRLKSARGGSGGRIEGIGEIQSGSTSFWSRLFGKSTASSDGGEDKEDEALIWGGKGSFKWEDIEGVDVSWGSCGLGMVKVDQKPEAKDEERRGNGLDEVLTFIWDSP